MRQKSPNVNRNCFQLWIFILGQVEIRLEEIQNEGLLVSWSFKNRPDLDVLVFPRLELPEVSGQQWEADCDWRKGGRSRSS